MTRIKTILCPVDFSETAEVAFNYALDLAGSLGGQIHLLHVYQLPIYSLPDGGVVGGASWDHHMREAAQKELDEFLQKHRDASVKVTPHIAQGLPHMEINRAATENAADLVVMGTHGRSGIPHLLMGSVAERVVRTSELPVLTIRGRRKPS